MNTTGTPAPARLSLSRACAWALLVAGWIGIGSLSLQFAPSIVSAFALTALWLLGLGGAAAVATRGAARWWMRASALGGVAACTAAGLWWSVHGGGLPALLLVIAGWAGLTALASGVVRILRQTQAAAPAPPILSATLGALCAGLVVGDPGDVRGLALRLAVLVILVATALIALAWRIAGRPHSPGCRAGLFDCSLPAWPPGAWRDALQWPMLLAGIAMLPMMAALPLMAAWCSTRGIAPQALVLLHLGAMFGPALLLQAWMARWPLRALAIVCAALLVAGAACAAWLPAPVDLAGVALTHGAAWGLAWSGQLWSPARRGRQGTSPWRAAAAYAALTLAFGFAVERAGLRGVAGVHIALGAGAVLPALLAIAGQPIRRLSVRWHARH